MDTLGGYKSPTVSSKLSPGVEKEEGKGTESFDNLLSSFRKLCTNFETNHKKLIRDKETFVVWVLLSILILEVKLNENTFENRKLLFYLQQILHHLIIFLHFNNDLISFQSPHSF